MRRYKKQGVLFSKCPLISDTKAIMKCMEEEPTIIPFFPAAKALFGFEHPPEMYGFCLPGETFLICNTPEIF